MALSAGYAAAGYDFAFLNNLVRQVVEEDAEIQYCLIMDADFRAIAHSDPEKVGSILNRTIDHQARDMMEKIFPATIANELPQKVHFIDESGAMKAGRSPVMEAVAPIYSGAKLFALLRCGYSLDRLSVEIRTAKQEWTQRSHQFNIYLSSITGLFLTIGVVIAALFTRAFVRSMEVVSTGVSRVAQGDLEHRILPAGLVCVELLRLAEAINTMTAELRISRKKLDDYSRSLEGKVAARTRELKDAQANLFQQAHEAGMAEMAVGILHNIGNAITPAKAELFRLFSRIRKRPLLADLTAALKEIEQLVPMLPELPDHKRKRLLEIIKLVPAAIEEEYALSANEIERIRIKLGHIESIIGLQMRYAHIIDDMESVDVPQVVDDALTLLDDALKKRSVRVVKDFSPVPSVRIEKTKLIQIIVNLIKNGYEAMEAIAAEDRTLALSIHLEKGMDQNLILSVKDNGAGFSSGQRHQLFTYGYTTKDKGSGFGLHSCANFLIANNGSISAHSDGRGKGAEFVIRLPVTEPNAG